MLNFLSSIAPMAGQALNIYSAAAPFLRRPQKAATSGLEAQQSAMAQALADPNSPLYKQFVEQEKSTMTQDFAGLLDQMVRRNRLERSMGRAGFIDPERGDEQLYRTFQQTLPRLQESATQAATSRLQAGAGAIGNEAARRIQAEQDRMGMANTYRAQQTAGAKNLADLLASLRGTQRINPADIMWNSNRMAGF